MSIEALIECAVGGSYEMLDGRIFWIDRPVAQEIARRAAQAIGGSVNVSSLHLAVMAAMAAHPDWIRVDGTPLANDLPMIAARAAMQVVEG